MRDLRPRMPGQPPGMPGQPPGMPGQPPGNAGPSAPALRGQPGQPLRQRRLLSIRRRL